MYIIESIFYFAPLGITKQFIVNKQDPALQINNYSKVFISVKLKAIVYTNYILQLLKIPPSLKIPGDLDNQNRVGVDLLGETK